MDKTKLGVIAFSAFCGAVFLLCAYIGTGILTADRASLAENFSAYDGKEGYIIKNEGGKISVYDLSDGTEHTEEICLQNLRDEDKKLLEKGIEAENKEQLLQLLEDFKS